MEATARCPLGIRGGETPGSSGSGGPTLLAGPEHTGGPLRHRDASFRASGVEAGRPGSRRGNLSRVRKGCEGADGPPGCPGTEGAQKVPGGGAACPGAGKGAGKSLPQPPGSPLVSDGNLEPGEGVCAHGPAWSGRSLPTHFATPSPPISWKGAQTWRPCRSSWATPTSPPPRSTPTSTGSISGRFTVLSIPGVEEGAGGPAPALRGPSPGPPFRGYRLLGSLPARVPGAASAATEAKRSAWDRAAARKRIASRRTRSRSAWASRTS